MRLSHPIQHAADFRIDQPIEILFPLFSAEGGKAVGLGAMGAAILLMANVEGDLTQQVIVVVSLLAILLLTGIALLLALASKTHQFLGVTGMHVISRIMSVLLSALAVQFIFDGIKQSGVIGA